MKLDAALGDLTLLCPTGTQRSDHGPAARICFDHLEKILY